MKRKIFLSGTFILFMMFVLLSFMEGRQDSGNQTVKSDPDYEKMIKRDFLIEDFRQLCEIIEASHPDPYSAGGGRIKFHYRMHRILNAIPENGMTKDGFIKLIRPFMAAIGDQHTSIYTDYKLDRSAPGGLPYVFGIIENRIAAEGDVADHQGVEHPRPRIFQFHVHLAAATRYHRPEIDAGRLDHQAGALDHLHRECIRIVSLISL